MRKKSSKIVIITLPLIVVIVLSLALGGCNFSSTEYTVSFNSNGGTDITSQTIEKGKSISLPTNPKKDGFDFAGWYDNAALAGEAIIFPYTPTKSIILYAKWSSGSSIMTSADWNKMTDDTIAALTKADANYNMILTAEFESETYTAIQHLEFIVDGYLCYYRHFDSFDNRGEFTTFIDKWDNDSDITVGEELLEYFYLDIAFSLFYDAYGYLEFENERYNVVDAAKAALCSAYGAAIKGIFEPEVLNYCQIEVTNGLVTYATASLTEDINYNTIFSLSVVYGGQTIAGDALAEREAEREYNKKISNTVAAINDRNFEYEAIYTYYSWLEDGLQRNGKMTLTEIAAVQNSEKMHQLLKLERNENYELEEWYAELYNGKVYQLASYAALYNGQLTSSNDGWQSVIAGEDFKIYLDNKLSYGHLNLFIENIQYINYNELELKDGKYYYNKSAADFLTKIHTYLSFMLPANIDPIDLDMTFEAYIKFNGDKVSKAFASLKVEHAGVVLLDTSFDANISYSPSITIPK